MINFAKWISCLLCLITAFSPLHATEIKFNPILKITSIFAKPESDTSLYNTDNSLYSNSEGGLRLNWDIKFKGNTGFFLHLKNNLQLGNSTLYPAYKQSVFRFQDWSYSWAQDDSGQLRYDLYQEVDRASFYTSADKFSFYMGRQAITWGLGRFWQPLDIFGAFSPLSLDREYKPGIDAVNLEWFPSDFSQLNLVYVFSNSDLVTQNDSVALHYIQQISERFYLSLLGSILLENAVLGFGIETEVLNAGVRTEAVFYQWDDSWQAIAVAGFDYQFNNEIILTLEQLYQSGGTSNLQQLPELQSSSLVNLGLQKHLSKSVTGIALQKNIFPLVDVSYTILLSVLNQPSLRFSSLHQFNVIYSTSNESDLTISLMTGSGKRIQQENIHSEFGHIPPSITAQYRLYF